jgi:hypothetical protein
MGATGPMVADTLRPVNLSRTRESAIYALIMIKHTGMVSETCASPVSFHFRRGDVNGMGSSGRRRRGSISIKTDPHRQSDFPRAAQSMFLRCVIGQKLTEVREAASHRR